VETQIKTGSKSFLPKKKKNSMIKIVGGKSGRGGFQKNWDAQRGKGELRPGKAHNRERPQKRGRGGTKGRKRERLKNNKQKKRNIPKK